MAGLYDAIDLKFSWNGDFIVSEGDFQDTSNDGIQSLIQDIQSICNSCLKDWEAYPGWGASLDDFIGESNTKYTAELIHDRVRVAITSAAIVSESDLQVKIVPISRYKILIIIKINAIPTNFNKLEYDQLVTVQMIFDYLERGITFFDKTPDLGVEVD
jgi:hypothetical protein